MDINNFLNIDGNENTDVENTSNTNISTEIEKASPNKVDDIQEPHISINKKDFLNILNIASILLSSGENTTERRVTTLKVEKGIAKFYLTDNKRYIEKTVQLINPIRQFEGFVSFQTDTLNKVVKLCENEVSIIQRIDKNKNRFKYSMKVEGGEIILDNINFKQETFIKNFTVDNDTVYNKNIIIDAIKRLSTFASTSINTNKSIDFYPNHIQSYSMNKLASISTPTEKYPNFKINLIDAHILYILLNTEDSETLNINSDGKVFRGKEFTFKTEIYATENCPFEQIANRMLTGESVTSSMKHLSKVIDLSCALEMSIGNVAFNYSKGLVQCTLMTRMEKNPIIINGTINDKVIDLPNPIGVSSINIKSTLGVFAGLDTINIRISTDGVSFENGNIKTIVLGKILA